MFKAKQPKTPLQDAFDRALRKLDEHEVGSDEYNAVLEEVNKLHKMLVEDRPDQVSMDTAAVIAANILGILLIIRHEHVNVIASKAMERVLRPKI